MTHIVDQYRDHLFSQIIPDLERNLAAAEMLKEAEVKEGELESLPDSAFAWPEERAFAIHTKEATVMSRFYRQKCAARVSKAVDQALANACDLYNIPEETFSRPKVAAAPIDPEEYLIPSLQRLRVKSAADIKTAEQRLLAEYQKLSVEHRAEACSRLVEKAAAFKVDLDPLMFKLAGFTVSSTRVLRDWLEARKEAAVKAEHKTAFAKLASALRDQPAEVWDRPTLIKLAGVIDELDQKAGLGRLYDRKLPDPMQSVFNTEKRASAGVELGGRMVPFTRLASFPAQFYGDALGDDFVREASDGRGGIDPQKAAMLIDTLPKDMRNVLAQQMGPYLR